MGDFDKFGRDMQNMANDFVEGARGVANNVASSVSGSMAGMGDGIKRAKDFSEVGNDLFITGAVTSHGGNLSVCDGNRLWITRHGSMLGHLGSADIIETSLAAPGDRDAECSVELPVHRAMYEGWAKRSGYVIDPDPADEQSVAAMQSFCAAIVHAHTRNTILRSLLHDAIEPLDSEGIYILGKTVAVLSPQKTIGSDEAAAMLRDAIIAGCNIAVIGGHGPFAIAETMQKAFQLVSCLEASSSILNMRDMIQRG